MSEFDSILRVALKDDTVFDGLLRLAQEQGCSLRDFLKGIALHTGGAAGATRAPLRNNAMTTDMESIERIAERQGLRALTDPIGLCRELGKLSEHPDIRDMTAEEARELCED